MASFDPKIFTRTDGLKRISNANLIALLSDFRAYLKGRGFEFPTNHAEDFPHEELAQLLMVYDPDIPIELMNGLYYIDEVASNETLDELMDRAEEDGVTIVVNGKATPADVATQIWIAKPELLMERAVRGLAFQKSSFMYFPGKRGKPRPLPNTREANLVVMAKLMDPWFEKKQRGAGTRIFAFPREDKVWLLVRHGMPMTREGKHEDDGSAGVAFYRPQKHDVMIYDAEHDLLAVNAGSKGE